MKEKWKNLLLAMAISVIIVLIYCSYFFLYAFPPVIEAMEGSHLEGVTVPSETVDPVTQLMILQMYLSVAGGAALCFCTSTILLYFAIDRWKKKK